METLLFYAKAVTLVILAVSTVYTAGVVWRVEMRLDASYKFFLAGILCAFAAEVADVFAPAIGRYALMLVASLKLSFAVCFLVGIILIRDIVRTIDGERDRPGQA